LDDTVCIRDNSVHGLGTGRSEQRKGKIMNLWIAYTGVMDDFGNLIDHDIDGLDLLACSLTGFY